MKGLRTHVNLDQNDNFTNATIIDDNNGLMHDIRVISEQAQNQMYRKLEYTLTSLHTGHTHNFKNEIAEALLYIVALSSIGLDKDWITGPWDAELPSDAIEVEISENS